MARELYLIDSNILIRWVKPEDANFPLVSAAILELERFQDIPCYVSQNLGEFWNALTRPADRNGYGLTPRMADRLAKQVETRFRLLPDSLQVHQEWRKLLVDLEVSGVQVHDARRVAAMLVHGVRRILTLNVKDFVRFSSIEAIHPAELARKK